MFCNQSVPTLIFTSKKDNENKENCTFEIIDFNQNIVPQLLQRLYEHRLQSVIIEGEHHYHSAFYRFEYVG